MENLNLVRDLDDKNKYITNMTDDKFVLYIDLLENFFKEYNNTKYRVKYNYYVNESGNFEKKNNETEETTIIKKPKYVNISEKLKDLDKQIDKLGYNLKKYRDRMIQDDTYDKNEHYENLKQKYLLLENDRSKITGYIDRFDNMNEKHTKIKTIKESLMKLNLEQYQLKNEIDEHKNNNESVKMKETIIKYLSNNKSINSHLSTVSELKLDRLSHNKYVIDEIFPNNTKSVKEKKTIFKNKTKTKDKTKDKDKTKTKDKDKTKTKDKDKTKPKDKTKTKDKDKTKDKTQIQTPVNKFKSPEFIDNSDEEIGEKETDEKEIGEKETDEKETGEKETGEKETGEKEPKKPSNNNGLDIEELDLGDNLEELQDSQENFSNFVGNNENDDDDEYVFNKTPKDQIVNEYDTNIPIDFEQEIKDKTELKKKLESKKLGSNKKKSENDLPDTDLDIDKISRQMNKKIKDPNIKIIKVDPNLQFSNISFTCDDTKTKRSDIETTDIADGKKRRKKNMDKELKNCMFPFKEFQGQGKGKKKKEVMINECITDGTEERCATERNPDCTTKKWAYCKK